MVYSEQLSQSAHSDKSKSAHGRRSSQRTSLFARARASFVRSGGRRGATCADLRGTSGAAFEATGDVIRGQSAGGCFCLGGRGGSDRGVIIMVKGPFCFVFKSESDAAPKYAISLSHMKAQANAQSSSREHSAVLETNLGDIEYEFIFKDSDTATSFETAALSQAAAGEAELVRKRLGHEHLLRKRASIRYAESVATKKLEDQPEAPVSADELMNAVPILEGPL